MPPRLGNQQPNGGRRRRPEEFRDGTHEPQSSDLSGHAEKLLPIQRPKDVSLHCHVVDQQGVRAGHSEKEAVLGTDGQHVGLGDERAEKGRVSPVRVLCSLPESRRERLDARPTGRGKATTHARSAPVIGRGSWIKLVMASSCRPRGSAAVVASMARPNDFAAPGRRLGSFAWQHPDATPHRDVRQAQKDRDDRAATGPREPKVRTRPPVARPRHPCVRGAQTADGPQARPAHPRPWWGLGEPERDRCHSPRSLRLPQLRPSRAGPSRTGSPRDIRQTSWTSPGPAPRPRLGHAQRPYGPCSKTPTSDPPPPPPCREPSSRSFDYVGESGSWWVLTPDQPR